MEQEKRDLNVFDKNHNPGKPTYFDGVYPPWN